MGRRSKGAAPQMRHHRAKGLAYVNDAGRQIYLGRWGSREARRAFVDYLNAWEAARASQDAPTNAVGNPGACLTVGDLCAAFLRHAEGYYRSQTANRPSQEYHTLRW